MPGVVCSHASPSLAAKRKSSRVGGMEPIIRDLKNTENNEDKVEFLGEALSRG